MLIEHSSTVSVRVLSIFFFFNDTATTEIYTLSLHDALPILYTLQCIYTHIYNDVCIYICVCMCIYTQDRKSTRLNSSHVRISYAVFCLKKNTSATGAGAHRSPR